MKKAKRIFNGPRAEAAVNFGRTQCMQCHVGRSWRCDRPRSSCPSRRGEIGAGSFERSIETEAPSISALRAGLAAVLVFYNVQPGAAAD